MVFIDGARFADSLARSELWPLSLVESNAHPHEVEAARTRLLEHENKLCSSKRTEVDISECTVSTTTNRCTAFKHSTISDLQKLEQYCNYGTTTTPSYPKARFVFLRAKNSRDRLYITPPMLKKLLTYHQVTAQVVDTLLSHGYTTDELDICACGFRGEMRTSPKERGLVMSEIGRSGRNLQVCYTLRTMERDTSRSKWKLRQTSTYHSFDVCSGNSFWLILKADKTMRDRIRTMADGPFSRPMAAFDTPVQCLKSAMASHLVMCSWAGENWRAYVSELEREVHELTHKAIDTDIRARKIPVSRTQTPISSAGSSPTLISRARTFSIAHARTFTSMFSRSNTDPIQPAVDLQAVTAVQATDDNDEDQDEAEQSDSQTPDVFSFNDMQDIQAIEEQANSALLVLRTNADTLGQLKEFYTMLDRSDGWPHDLSEQCKGQIVHFVSRINNVEYDLRLQQARLENLTRLLADRKALLYAVFEYQNTLMNQELATRAQHSQVQMQNLTEHMSVLAEKTQQETVSMKIITLVTLFFLPGTFISTLMSTDIIKFGNPANGDLAPTQELFSVQALQLFFKITAPLMVGTFLAWYVLHWWTNRNTKSPNASSQDLEAGLGISKGATN